MASAASITVTASSKLRAHRGAENGSAKRETLAFIRSGTFPENRNSDPKFKGRKWRNRGKPSGTVAGEGSLGPDAGVYRAYDTDDLAQDIARDGNLLMVADRSPMECVRVSDPRNPQQVVRMTASSVLIPMPSGSTGPISPTRRAKEWFELVVDGNDLDLVYIPEPRHCVLAMALLAGIVAYRKRRYGKCGHAAC